MVSVPKKMIFAQNYTPLFKKSFQIVETMVVSNLKCYHYIVFTIAGE